MNTRLYHSDEFDFCFRFDALTELGAFMRTEFLCISVSSCIGPRVKLAGHESALTSHSTPPPLTPPPPVVCSADRSEAVVPALVLVLLCVALWFILRGDLFYVLPCVIFILVFFSPFSTAITSFGEKRAILVLFVRLFDLPLFGFVCLADDYHCIYM